MDFPTPHSIKVKVIEEWIQRISRDKIALKNNIGSGTVTSIIQQAKANNGDIDLMRELAIKIKKEKTELNHFASSVRLKTVLNGLDIRRKDRSISRRYKHIVLFKESTTKNL